MDKIKDSQWPIPSWLEECLSNQAPCDLDDLPEKDTPLRRVMEANGILASEQRSVYASYDESHLGCNIERPIIIDEIEEYVQIEYELLEYILRPFPYRFVDYELYKQKTIIHDGRVLDVLTVKVYSHPLALFEKKREMKEQSKKYLGQEEYWFDITEGYRYLQSIYEE